MADESRVFSVTIAHRVRLLAVGLVLVIVGLLTPASTAAAEPPPTQVQAHGYDSPHYDQPTTCTATQRGPPIAYVVTAASAGQRAVDSRSHGAVECLLTPGTYGYTTYDPHAALAHIDRTAGTTEGPSKGIRGDLSSLAGAQVAANAGTRLAQDIAVSPVTPRALGLGRSIGRASHNQALQAEIAALPRGATGIRVNQQQVNALGQRVGINRPDLQYTLNGQRYYVEYEGLANPRGALHEARILANDPGANFILRIVP